VAIRFPPAAGGRASVLLGSRAGAGTGRGWGRTGAKPGSARWTDGRQKQQREVWAGISEMGFILPNSGIFILPF